MKACIFGAGAVGSYLAARIGQADSAHLSVVARGRQLEAIRHQGIRLEAPGESITVQPASLTDQPLELPAQDVVFVALKVMAQPDAACAIRHLIRDGGCAVFAANGVPWWWKYGTARPAALPLLDPDAQLWDLVTPEQALGCVVYSANEVIAPGVVRHLGNNRWVLGESDSSHSDRLARIVAMLRASGVHAEASTEIRTEIWAKLLRNASLNSLCALTRLPVDGLAEDAELLALADALIDEIIAIAASQGCHVEGHRAAAREQLRRGGAEGGAPAVKGMRPSMLQDALAGRALEVEAILGQAQALAAEAGVPCPTLGQVLPLVRGLDRSLKRQ
ncbi:MAG: 2-dehydropantoate 2-reductase [Burkholderiaceae bacterium]|uniref:ketopantoate reductase family protein n=1 Tax=Castellaniella sp. TaxID=1955812 RepID=UPI0035607344